VLRLGRWISAVGLLSVLISAATAYAECAWVLWDDVVSPFHTIEFRKTAAYESRAACLRAAEVRAQRLLGKSLQVQTAPDGTWMADSADGKKTYTAQCWPDTTEPNRVGQPSQRK
jgi:hypothetical protein